MPVTLPTDSNFEKTFADLAYVRLKDKAPTLLDHLVGFQLVDKNDEETHAVGVFGFKIGDDWAYAPVFFINGELKGYELLYLKSQDAFVPLTEEWTNYVLNRKPIILGEGEPRDVTQKGVRPPDFDVYARPPYIGSKYGSARKGRDYYEKHMQKWALPILDVFMVSPKDEKYASLDLSFNLPVALKRLGEKAAASFFKTMKEKPEFAEAVLKFYNESDLVNFQKSAAKYTKQQAGYMEDASMRKCGECVNYDSSRCSLVQGDISESGSCKYWSPKLSKGAYEQSVKFDKQDTGRVPDSKPVVVVHGDDMSNMTEYLSEADRAALMRDGYVVKDERSDDKRTRAYKSQLSAQLSSPTASGRYTVLGPGGEKREVIILKDMAKVGLGTPGVDEQFIVAIDPEKKSCGKFYSSDVLALEFLGPLDTVRGYVNPSSLKIGDRVFLVDPSNSNVTNPFEVDRIMTDSDGVTTIDVSSCYMPSPSASSTLKTENPLRYPRLDTANGDEMRIESIVLTGKEGDSWQRIGNSLFVPEGAKAWVLKSLTPEERKNRVEPYRDTARLELATSTDILMRLSKAAAENKGIAELQLKTDGTQFWTRVNDRLSPMMSKLAMLKHLVQDVGLGKDDALSMIGEVKPHYSQHYWLKAAGAGVGVATPYFNEPNMGQESWLNAPVQYPMTELQNLEQPLTQNRAFYENLGMVDDDPRMQAQNAAQQGQKEILDTSIISGLVKLTDVDTRVDSYIGDLLLGLDRIGRILFMYYWHNEKFRDRYGQEDMAKLEDSLRNVFSSLGELTLFLKQKTIDTGVADSAEAELTSVLTGG